MAAAAMAEAADRTSQPTVILKHGAFADGSSWNRVIAGLRRDGYPVVAAALRGLIAHVDGPVILVGHSYGGSAAGAGNSKVKALLYAAAFLPEVGESALGLSTTPPGSACSIIFGDGLTPTAPGTYLGPHLIVTDLEAALTDLAARGVTVSGPFRDESGVFHHLGDAERVPGFHPERAGYGSFASFHDPDGNQWFLQEITQRAPGR